MLMRSNVLLKMFTCMEAELFRALGLFIVACQSMSCRVFMLHRVAVGL